MLQLSPTSRIFVLKNYRKKIESDTTLSSILHTPKSCSHRLVLPKLPSQRIFFTTQLFNFPTLYPYVIVASWKIRSFVKITEKIVRTKSSPNFIYSNEERGKYRLNPEEKKKMVVTFKFGFGSRLHKGKVLTPLTFIVVNKNLLVKLAIKCWIMFIVFFEWWRSLTEKKRGCKIVFIRVLDEIAGLAPTYPLIQWGTQSFVVQSKTKYILMFFYYSACRGIESHSHICSGDMEKSKRHSSWEDYSLLVGLYFFNVMF